MLMDLKGAAKLLHSDGVIAVPTETVYGLAAKLNSNKGIEKIYSLKNRPKDNPLIIHLGSKEQLNFFIKESDKMLFKLIDTFWPGALTVVVDIDITKVPSIARAGLKTAAFRIPEHPIAQKLLGEVGPLVMPSANISGKPSSTRAEHVQVDFGLDVPVIDGGVCNNGLESTIVVKKEGKWKIARAGAISDKEIAKVLGYIPKVHSSKGQIISPGMKYRHYSPKSKLTLFEDDRCLKGTVVVGFSEKRYEDAKQIYTLGSLENPLEVSRNFYHILRQLDKDGVLEALVDVDFPKKGLFKTLFERLEKASK